MLVSGGAEPLTIAGASSDGSITWAAVDTVGLPAGDYTISVADAAGCTRDTALVIAALPALTLSASGTSISCQGAENGAIEATASGGSVPLTLGAEGPGGLLLEPFESLSAGTYTIGVVDARGASRTPRSPWSNRTRLWLWSHDRRASLARRMVRY